MGLLLGGIALGCFAVLYPFFSALLWAGILVFTTWPVHEWVRARLHLRRTFSALAMVALTAIVLVLPIALAAPGGAEDVARLRRAIEAALRGGLPTAPPWLGDLPLVGPSLAELWDHWAADIGALLTAFRPFFGLFLVVVSGDHRLRQSNFGFLGMPGENCCDFIQRDIRQQIEVHPHCRVGNLHDLFHHAEGRFRNADVVDRG